MTPELDRVNKIYGFTPERYRRLQRSQLSIIGMNNVGARLAQLFGLRSSINIDASDRDFLNFVRDPWRHVNSNIRSNINWFNAVVVMYTEDRDVLEEFDRLPFAKKVCFVPFETELDSGFYIRPFYVGGREFRRAVERIASHEIVCFDLWDLLIYGRKTSVNLHSRARGDRIALGNHYETSDGRIKYFNHNVTKVPVEQFAMTRFIRENVPGDKTFNFFGPFGDPRLVRAMNVERKIFSVQEEVFTWPWYDGFQDYCLDSVALAIGCEPLDNPKYLRMPLALTHAFGLKLDREWIEQRIAEINSARSTRKYDCVLINSHDMMNTRTPICNRLKDILEIKFAGKWNRNTDELQTVYADDKVRYVHEFRFNICDKFMRQEKFFPKPTVEYVLSTLEELARRLRDMP